MRKIALLAVAGFVLSIAAIAYAQSQTNTYTVTGSTSPTRSGTKSKPVAVGLKFGFTVGEAANNRPAVVEKYNLRFAGINVNTAGFPACTLSTLEQRGPDGCPKGSDIGTGFIENETGATNNPADKSIQCNAALTVYNAGGGKAVIYVAGSPNASDPREKCAIELAAGIPARWIRAAGGAGTSLEFTVPESLRHPGAPTISNAVKKVTSSLKRVTRKRNGRTVGYIESIGGCVRKKRNITATFTTEAGDASRAQRLAACS